MARVRVNLTPLDHLDLAWDRGQRWRDPVGSLMKIARRIAESGVEAHDTLGLHLYAALEEMSLDQIRGYLTKREEMSQ